MSIAGLNSNDYVNDIITNPNNTIFNNDVGFKNNQTPLDEKNMNALLEAIVANDNNLDKLVGNLNEIIAAINATVKPLANEELVNNALSKKANIASPSFTGSPKAPKPETGDNSTRIATTSFVNEALTNRFAQLEIVKVIGNVSEVNQPNILYLIPGSVTGTDDLYDEYVFVNNKVEKIGSVGAGTSIDGYNEDYNLDNYDNYVNPTLEDGNTNTSYVGNRISPVKFVQQAIDATLNEINTTLTGIIEGTV